MALLLLRKAVARAAPREAAVVGAMLRAGAMTATLPPGLLGKVAKPGRAVRAASAGPKAVLRAKAVVKVVAAATAAVAVAAVARQGHPPEPRPPLALSLLTHLLLMFRITA